MEPVLASSSGWEDKNVAQIRNGAKKGPRKPRLENIIFGLEHVYAVSEAICGIMEWLRETVSEFFAVEDLDPHY
jgi:hypothetical protein